LFATTMVRAAPNQEQVRTARGSLLGAAGAALIILVLWFSLRTPAEPVARQRTLVDTPVEWVCARDKEHHFRANGRYEPLPCRVCDGQCFIRLRYACPVHGEFESLVQIQRVDAADKPEGAERVAFYRYPRGEWQACDGRVPCPVAGCTERTRPAKGAWSPPAR
jgi:hypothetical protein